MSRRNPCTICRAWRCSCFSYLRTRVRWTNQRCEACRRVHRTYADVLQHIERTAGRGVAQ